jgi:hypothetical protein|tara:strand:+ start:422 stop:790 length:369 start_codon:yes stop_codon:yes gene_type:complete
MVYLRKYISYFLIFTVLISSSFSIIFTAAANTNKDSNIVICTSEGIKYLSEDGSIKDTENSQTYHNYCLDCTACDSNLYAITKFRYFIDINLANQKFILFKSNLNNYSFTLNNLIRGPPFLS